VARALIVGCGCRGQALGVELIARGWQVRGTSRERARLSTIEATGIEAAHADPDRAGTILELVGDVTVVVWALGSATGPPALVEAVNGSRLEAALERLVDTPVRGFVYEAAGSAPVAVLEAGSLAVRTAADRWRIPVAVVTEAPDERDAWMRAMARAAGSLIGLE